jgi:hypothetical protein
MYNSFPLYLWARVAEDSGLEKWSLFPEGKGFAPSLQAHAVLGPPSLLYEAFFIGDKFAKAHDWPLAYTVWCGGNE